MKTNVPTITLSELSEVHRNFLIGIMALPAKKPHEKVAVYQVMDGNHNYAWVQDSFVYLEHSKKFSAEAPDGLCLTGASVIVQVKLRCEHFALVSLDERTKQAKNTPIGWANADEGGNLIVAALREFEEELTVFSPDRKVQYVPLGVKASLKVSCWNIDKIDAAQVLGEIVPIRWDLRPNKVLVLVCGWHYDALPENTLIAYDDDWWQGGAFGTNVWLVDKYGKLRGIYDGQRGPQFLDDYAGRFEDSLARNPDLYAEPLTLT